VTERNICDGKDILVYNNNYQQENVRLRYCDGKDKYLHPTGVKDVEYILF
jgi:hypothetical protein